MSAILAMLFECTKYNRVQRAMEDVNVEDQKPTALKTSQFSQF